MLRAVAALVLLLGGQVLAGERSPAEIIAFQGTTEVRETAGQTWQPAHPQHRLPALSTVRTGAASWASILFVDQTQIKLSAHSQFQIKGVARERQERTLVELRKGKAWTRSKTPPRRFIMQTPSANAGIQGTDWVMEVADDGTATLTVLSGEIRFYNTQGEVLVGRHEEAVAAPGRAPVKRPLVDPAGRVQWVGTHPIQWQRYPELLGDARYRPLVQALREGHQAEALALLKTAGKVGDTATLRLLEADIAQSAGDLSGARQRLTAAMERWPDDPRLPAALTGVALLMDDEQAAGQLLQQGLARHPRAAELWLAKGDLARWQGEREAAENGYERAATLAPEDARPRLGSGRIASEREDFTAGRRYLLEALERSPDWSEALGELGWLETQADDLAAARRYLEQALERDPGDYVALTSLGYLELKSGDPEAALRHLLAANTIEPRYARAVQTMAIAYYQLHRLGAALDSLTRAAELDPRNPMPWFLSSLIYQDQWRPGDAVRAARQGITRLPYLKSLNQLAADLKGSANLGSAYAHFGLEDWAMRTAQDSYDPFWAGSHFFLANRYAGEFSRNAELTLGFLTDPTAFGSDPRWQSLVASPGTHGQLSYWHEQGEDERTQVPAAILSGYRNDGMPYAWLLEGQSQNWRDDTLETGAGQLTLGLGLKPDPDLRLFLFANHFQPNVTRQVTGGEQDISGENRRVDAGLSLRHGPEAQTWLKAGRTRERSTSDGPDSLYPDKRERFELRPEGDDLQLRHTRRLHDRVELSLGLEWARREDVEDIRIWGDPGASPSTTARDWSEDESTLAYASLKLSPLRSLWVQADLSHIRVVSDSLYRAQSGNISWLRGDYHETTDRWQFGLGGIFRPTPEWTLRGALQDWTRPVSFNTLSPVATAGIPVDDLFTLPGGRLQRGKLQLEWQGDRSLTMLWLDHRKIHNISFDVVDYTDNDATELAELSRLDPQSFGSLALDIPEGTPLFSSGKIKEWGLSHERVLSDTLSLYLRYRRADGENTRWFKGNDLPYLPEHQGSIGLTWLPAARWILQARATYRSERFADTMNNTALTAGWSGDLAASWQSHAQDWRTDIYLTSLFNESRPTGAGLALTFRF